MKATLQNYDECIRFALDTVAPSQNLITLTAILKLDVDPSEVDFRTSQLVVVNKIFEVKEKSGLAFDASTTDLPIETKEVLFFNLTLVEFEYAKIMGRYKI
jgi:hypothetical protein